MEAIYDKQGYGISWLYDHDVLDQNGNRWAFVEGEDVFSYRNGKHLGWFDAGAFWDHENRPIAWIETATAPLTKPGMTSTPGRPGVGGRPGRPFPPAVPSRPAGSNEWSSMDWQSWLEEA